MKLSAAMRDPEMQARIRDLIARDGRAHIPNVLEAQCARELLEAMQQAPWKQIYKQGAQTVRDDPAEFARLPPNEKVERFKGLYGQAVRDFQFMFDSYGISSIYENNERRDGVLADFYVSLNAPQMLEAWRAITGDARIASVDAQATRYRPGHFLTQHDDSGSQDERLFAYVLNLTPDWNADWGGLLQFFDEQGHVTRAYTPRWNALNLFRVPADHAVSIVAPFAPTGRFSITGWMRANRPAS